MSRKKNIAFFSFGIAELSGGGGAERFFADFFDFYQIKERQFNLHWLIDNDSVKHLRDVGKLNEEININKLIVFSNRFKNFLENMQLLFFIIRKRIEIVHIPWYNSYYISFLVFVQKLPRIVRPKISINIVDCSLPFCFLDDQLPRHNIARDSYEPLFRMIKVDGYFAWNKSFIDFFYKNKFNFPGQVLCSITSRFCDTSNFSPDKEKQNLIVFASRLTVFKNADWYLHAINYLKTNEPNLIKGWKFLVCGDGPNRRELINFSNSAGLSELVEFRIEGNLSNILNSSKCFVSCQDFDNFPSLSMAEAMASGNAIVSRDVGQTSLFVEDGKNGFLAETDDSHGIAMAIKKFILNSENFKAYSDHSVKLIREVHTATNFVRQIEDYWIKLLSN